MYITRRITQLLVLAALASSLQGCIGFSGPNDVRRAIARSQDVILDKEFGVDVGPLSIGFANLVAAPYLPVSLDGLTWVSVGQYTIRPHHADSINTFSLTYLELKGWETFAHIRDKGSNVKVMYNAAGEKLTQLLAIIQDDDELIIAKLHGDFEKLMNNLLDSELFDDIDFFGDDFDPDDEDSFDCEPDDLDQYLKIVRSPPEPDDTGVVAIWY